MRTLLIITIVVVLSLLLSFVFFLLNYQYFDDKNHIYAFKPSNAPSSEKELNQTITTTNISKQQHQQQSSNNKDALEMDSKITSADKSKTTYKFIHSWGSKGTGDGQFNSPSDIAIDSSTGNVYVADWDNHRIQKFDSNGNFITKWGSYGNGTGQFDRPQGIAIDSNNNVYVADSLNLRIQKFDSNGNFITKWGEYGTEDGQFDSPGGIAINSQDNVYVADTGNQRIQKFDSNGNFITKWGNNSTTYGTEDVQFGAAPTDIAVDSSGNVYVIDYNNHRIQKFDSNGNFLVILVKKGDFNYPNSIAIDSLGNIYVSDSSLSESYPPADRIEKFDSNGTFITGWGRDGMGEGQFLIPSGIAVDSSGYVYVADSGNDRIQVFAPTAPIK